MLVDAHILPLHATVRLIGDRLMLRATGEGVTVFTRKLAAGRKTMLTHGATFNLGDMALQFNTVAPPSALDTQRAERTLLFKHAPLTWLRRQCARLAMAGRRF